MPNCHLLEANRSLVLEAIYEKCDRLGAATRRHTEMRSGVRFRIVSKWRWKC